MRPKRLPACLPRPFPARTDSSPGGEITPSWFFRPWRAAPSISQAAKTTRILLGQAAGRLDAVFGSLENRPELQGLRCRYHLPFDGIPLRLHDQLFSALERQEPYRSYARQYREELEAAAVRVLKLSDLPAGSFLHGDLRPPNVLAADGRGLLLDLETTHWGPSGFDLVYLLRSLVAVADETCIIRILKGFRELSDRHGLVQTTMLALLDWCDLQELWLCALGARFAPTDWRELARAQRKVSAAFDKAGALL